MLALDPSLVSKIRKLPGSDQTWIGGVRPVPGVGGLAVWVEPATGLIRGCAPFEDEPASVALLQVLVMAMLGPVPGTTPARPLRVACDDPGLLAELKRVLAPLGIEGVHSTSCGEIVDQCCEEILESVSGPRVAFSYLAHDAGPGQVAQLFEASRRLWSLAPWKRWDSDVHILEVSERPPSPLYVSVLGSGGFEKGLGIYLDERGMMAVAEGRTERLLRLPSLSLTYDRTSDVDPEIVAEIRRHGWKGPHGQIPLVLRSDREDNPAPTASEIRLVCSLVELLEAGIPGTRKLKDGSQGVVAVHQLHAFAAQFGGKRKRRAG